MRRKRVRIGFICRKKVRRKMSKSKCNEPFKEKGVSVEHEREICKGTQTDIRK